MAPRWAFWVFLSLTANALLDDGYCRGVPSSLALPSWHTQYELVAAQVITRHGDRTPQNTFSKFGATNLTDPAWTCGTTHTEQLASGSSTFKTVSLAGRQGLPGNCSLGVLTDRGVQQMEQLGTLLRERYVDQLGLLPSNLSEAEVADVFARSSQTERTLESARSLVSGLYPSNTCDAVIPVYTMDPTYENLNPNPTLCGAFGPTVAGAYSEPAFASFVEQSVQPVAQQAATLAGFDVAKITSSLTGWNFDFMALLEALRCHDKPLPLPRDLIAAIENGTAFALGWPASSNCSARTQVNQVGIGPLMHDLVTQMQRAIAGTGPKFQLYSGHDGTIGSVMGLFGVYSEWPPYGSSILLEAWKSRDSLLQGNVTYTLTYNGVLQALPFCSGGFGCSEEEWVVYLGKNTPSAVQCKLPSQAT